MRRFFHLAVCFLVLAGTASAQCPSGNCPAAPSAQTMSQVTTQTRARVFARSKVHVFRHRQKAEARVVTRSRTVTRAVGAPTYPAAVQPVPQPTPQTTPATQTDTVSPPVSPSVPLPELQRENASEPTARTIPAAFQSPGKSWVFLTKQNLYGYGYRREDGLWVIDPGTKKTAEEYNALCAATVVATGDPYGFTGWLNSVRASYGLGAVAHDANLAAWAQQNNLQQQSRGLGHYVLGPARRQNSAVGAYAQIGGMWLASPGHRAALLDPTITACGIAGLGAYWTFSAR